MLSSVEVAVSGIIRDSYTDEFSAGISVVLMVKPALMNKNVK